MDTLKLAVLAFIAGGVVLYMADVSTVNAILISALVSTVVMIIAVLRCKEGPPKPRNDAGDSGPTFP